MTNNADSNTDREYEEGAAGTIKDRKHDPLKEYSEKEAMTPAKIKEHESTAVSRDPNDQKIAGEGQTGTDSPEALEEYRGQGMTKVGDDNTSTTLNMSEGPQQRQYQTGGLQQEQEGSSVEEKTSEAANTVKEGAESTFDKLKAGVKALGKKVSDPDTSLEEEYNKEKTQ